MIARDVLIKLSTDREIADGCIFKGTVTNKGQELYKIVAWLKSSQFESALYYFYINEDVKKGEQGAKFTPKPVTIKAGQNGLYPDGMIFEIDGLKFPLGGNVDFENDTKTITLGLASEKSRVYYKEKKHMNYVLEAAGGEGFGEETEVPF